VSDPWKSDARKFHNLSAEIADFIKAAQDAAGQRQEILQGMHDAGLTYREMAEVVDLSVARVWQILNGKN
jgi:hypothetical protein